MIIFELDIFVKCWIVLEILYVMYKFGVIILLVWLICNE